MKQTNKQKEHSSSSNLLFYAQSTMPLYQVDKKKTEERDDYANLFSEVTNIKQTKQTNTEERDDYANLFSEVANIKQTKQQQKETTTRIARTSSVKLLTPN